MKSIFFMYNKNNKNNKKILINSKIENKLLILGILKV